MQKKRRVVSGHWRVRFKRVYLIFIASYLIMLMMPLAGILHLYNQVTEKNGARSALTVICDTATAFAPGSCGWTARPPAFCWIRR